MSVTSLSKIASNVAGAAELSRAKAHQATEAVFSEISASLARGEEIRIPGFGTFKIMHRKARSGRNPRTGTALQVAASNTVKFKEHGALHDAVQPPPERKVPRRA